MLCHRKQNVSAHNLTEESFSFYFRLYLLVNQCLLSYDEIYRSGFCLCQRKFEVQSAKSVEVPFLYAVQVKNENQSN